MRTIAETDFLNWAKERGLGLDPKYPQSAVLRFIGGSGESRFWSTPPEAERRPYFLGSFLDLLGDWTSCFVWRHLGRWPDETRVDPRRPNDVVECQILKGLGLPVGSTEVVEFMRGECAGLLTLLFSTTVFGWSVGEDLYVVPNHTRHILQTDHHDAVHVEFRYMEDVAPWVAQMEARGFPLPDEVPDETFKQPGWMGRHDR